MRWVPMVGYNGYLINEAGQVRNISTGRILPWHRSDKTNSRSKIKREIYVVRPWGHYTAKPVHHAVLESFVGPRPTGYVAGFRDKNTLNPVLDNLVWQSHHDSHHKKMSQDKVALCRHYHDQYHNKNQKKYASIVRALAHHFGVSTACIYNIMKGRTWKKK